MKTIFTDDVSADHLIALMQCTDLFVYPALSDTLPLVILEAMAAGVPILSTKVGGIPSQVDDDCGVLVDPGNPERFRRAFENLAENKNGLKKMGAQAREVVRSKFDWKSRQKILLIIIMKL